MPIKPNNRKKKVDKVLVFLVFSGNPFHARIPDGKNENLYVFVLAYGIRKVFLSLCLSEGCIKLSLCCISKLELIALCIITTLPLVLLSCSVSRFNDLTNGVILVSFEYSPVMNLAALF